MINGSREPGSIDFEQTDDSALIELIACGSAAAFTALFDRTSAEVRAELQACLADIGQISEVFAATYVEVWWLAGHRRAPAADVRNWLTGILHRRTAEALRDAPSYLSPRPSYVELEVAALLKRPVERLLRLGDQLGA